MVNKINYIIILISTLFIGNFFNASSQQLITDKYRIQFTDKNNTPYNKGNPQEYLSEKAIKRRLIQNIKIQQNDFPVNPDYIDSIQKTGVRILNKSKWLNYITVDRADSIALSRIKSFPFVSEIETVSRVFLKNNLIPLLPEKKIISEFNPELINLNNKKPFYSENYYEYGYSFEQIHMIACDFLHKAGYKGKGISIGVLDAGFINADKLPVFSRMKEENRIKGTKDFVDPGGNVYSQSTHGMMVLSIMAGYMPGYYIGAAPEADYWLLRTEEAKNENIIEEDNWVSAIEFADSVGVDIINSSLGYTRFMDSTKNHSFNDLDGYTTRISKAASIAARKGIIVVCSAGNEGDDNSWGFHISAPADADSILSVGAVDINGKYAYFSSRGPTFDGRIKPDVAALGKGTAVSSSSGTILTGNGTSFSSPLIAGMTACLWQSKPEAYNMEIISAIKKTSSHFQHPDNFTGYGIPNSAAAYLLLAGKDFNYFNFSSSILVSPNPFSSEVDIILHSPGNLVNLELYDITGKKVYLQKTVNASNKYTFISLLGLENLQNNIYFIKIYTDNKIYVRKIMKIN